MSDATTPAPLDSPGEPPERSGRLSGIGAVARQEFRMRIRTGRWRWVLAAWVAALAALTVLTRLAVGAGDDYDGREGIPTFGILMLLLLGLSLLVVPALTAQSVNGDRERGVLAILQITLLRPYEIALGKLLAAWGTALVFLALAVPMVAATMLMGGVGVAQVGVGLLIVAVLLGVVCALAQCLSAMLARTVTSAVLSYLVVAALTAGTPILFGLSLLATEDEVTRTYEAPNYDEQTGQTLPGTHTERYTETQSRPEKVWWLLAPNPFVILADAAPDPPRRRDPRTGELLDDAFDPLGEISRAVREARTPDTDEGGWFAYAPLPQPAPAVTMSEAPTGSRLEPVEDGRFGITVDDGLSPVWPYGLAFDASLGAGAVAITIRRLRTPARKIPRGTRIA